MRRSLASALRRAGLAACLALAGCATPSLQDTTVGELRGELAVVWVGEDRFVHLGGPAGLSFRSGRDGTTVVPGLMYTDGGSIPRALRGWRGFSPWGYAPAYIVHDWLFHLRHCDAAALGPIDFARSAEVLAEVIRTLMAKGIVRTDPTAFGLIGGAVETSIARDLWERGSCEPVTPEHERLARAVLRAETTPGLRAFRVPRPGEAPRVVFRARIEP